VKDDCVAFIGQVHLASPFGGVCRDSRAGHTQMTPSPPAIQNAHMP
jgi:hypothetical protein